MPQAAALFDPVLSITIPIHESPSVGTNEETSGLIESDFRPSSLSETSNVVGNTIFRQGGNVHRLRVEGRIDRDSHGDAEAWSYLTLRNLGATGLSTLLVNNRAYDKVYFTSGTANILKTSGGAFVDYSLEFVRSAPFFQDTLEPLFASPPELGTFPGRNSNGDYVIIDFQLFFIGGDVVAVPKQIAPWSYAEIRNITVRRPVLVKPIPRSYGAIIEPLRSGREITLNLFAALHPDASVIGNPDPTGSQDRSAQRGRLENVIQQMEWRIRDKVLYLTGNGNTFIGMHVRRISPRHDDSQWTSYCELEMVQELVNVF